MNDSKNENNILDLKKEKKYFEENEQHEFEKDDPTIYGEEIDQDPCCCVMRLLARPDTIPANSTFQHGGVSYANDFSRNMRFQINMKNAADAAKVRVIQYWKDEKYSIQNGQGQLGLNQQNGPTPNPGWQWVPGNDGWTVDSVDANRCWPNLGIRGNVVLWGDHVSISKAALQQYLAQGHPSFTPGPVANGGDFPHEYSVKYKTDIFCSDRDVCSERVAQNQETPIASVSWDLKFTLDTIRRQGNLEIASKVSDVKIENIRRNVYNWCPSSPHRQVGPF